MIAPLVAVCLLIQPSLSAQDAKEGKSKKGKNKEANFDKEVNQAKTSDAYLKLLNEPGNQPESTLQIGAALFAGLSKSKDASFFDLSNDNTFVSLCQENSMLCTGGPMLGSISQSGVKVWVRTLLPGKVEVRVDADGKTATFGPVTTSAEGDLRAVVPVTGMKPGKEYPYKVFVDGRDAFPDRKFTFRTVPGGKADVTVAFGCDFHKAGAANMKQT